MRTQTTAFIQAIPRIGAVYLLIAIWENSTAFVPTTNRQSTVQPEFFLSLLILVLGAFWIGTRFAIGSWGFVFGVAGSLLFVPRFNYASRFAVQLAMRTENDLQVYCCITAAILGLGLACRHAVWMAEISTDKRKAACNPTSDHGTSTASSNP